MLGGSLLLAFVGAAMLALCLNANFYSSLISSMARMHFAESLIAWLFVASARSSDITLFCLANDFSSMRQGSTQGAKERFLQ